MEFVSTFKDQDLDELLEEAYERVNVAAQKHPILRIGAGSGFHAMTGDWQFENHIETGVHRGGRNDGKKKYKSRKFAFEFNESLGENGEYVFLPYGVYRIN